MLKKISHQSLKYLGRIIGTICKQEIKEAEKDLVISNAEVTFLETGRTDTEVLLETFRALCPKATF